jgi:hypothetical protein
MVERSAGTDLVVADEIYHRAETQDFLRSLHRGATEDKEQFTGFAEPIRIWRIAMPLGRAD